MVSAREEILGKLRSSLKDTKPIDNSPDLRVPTPIRYNSKDEKIAHFVEKLTAARAEIYQLTSDSWVSRFIQIMEYKNLQNLLYSPTTNAGTKITEYVLTHKRAISLNAYDPTEANWREKLFFKLDAAITSSIAGVASTGTLIVRPSPQEPRLMNIVPPTHFLLVKASEIYNNLSEAEQALQLSKKISSSLIFVSGPSKTADIEQKLAYGAHGPKELIILLLLDA